MVCTWMSTACINCIGLLRVQGEFFAEALIAQHDMSPRYGAPRFVRIPATAYKYFSLASIIVAIFAFVNSKCLKVNGCGLNTISVYFNVCL